VAEIENRLPTYAMTYVVYWPEHGVLKVGRAWRFHRVQMMTRSGGHVVVLARGTDATWEREALRSLRRWFPAAFDRAADSADLLFMERGWTECFAVGEHHLQLAVDVCIEGFARGNDQGVNRARKISAADLQTPGFMRAPDEAKPTAFGLWLHTDVDGRREMVPELIAGDLYPGRAAVEMVSEHLLMLDESGFLTMYRESGRDWIALTHPLRSDRRTAPPSQCPPPPGRDTSRQVAAVGRAPEQARAEAGERASQWAAWEQEQERRTRPPARPLLLDAPPIGCPEHPSGRFADCGPCGTARRRHDHWLAERRYEQGLADAPQPVEDEEPW
jgi:hypothetical protein